MPRTPVTGLLLTDLRATARADGVAFAHAATVVEHDGSILLLHQGDGDAFSPFRWQLPTGLVMGVLDELADVIHRAVTHTAGFDLDQVTSYLGHHDELACDRAITRTFGFTAVVGDPAKTRRDARFGHQWLRTHSLPLRFPADTDRATRDLVNRAAGLPATARIRQPEPALAEALRAGARGLFAAEAAVELLIASTWPHRHDFAGFMDTGTSITDGTTELAHIDWTAAITALDGGDLPCGGAERRILRLAASIAEGLPVDLQEALTSLDDSSINQVVQAVRHASGRRPADQAV